LKAPKVKGIPEELEARGKRRFRRMKSKNSCRFLAPLISMLEKVGGEKNEQSYK